MNNTYALTEREAQCLYVIECNIRVNDMAHSCEEIKIALGLASKSGVHRLLQALERKGRIQRLNRRARAIEVKSPLRGSEVAEYDFLKSLAVELKNASERLMKYAEAGLCRKGYVS